MSLLSLDGTDEMYVDEGFTEVEAPALPSPELLREYESILPGAQSELLRLHLRATRHHQELLEAEERAQEARAKNESRLSSYTFLLAIGICLAAASTALVGQPLREETVHLLLAFVAAGVAQGLVFSRLVTTKRDQSLNLQYLLLMKLFKDEKLHHRHKNVDAR